MSWAARRRFIILSIIGAVVIAFFAIVSFSLFHKAPSCSDGVQNQGEAGIDCGGPCPYLCTALEHAPTVLYTKQIPSGAGRTDVIASIENVNAGVAAKSVRYTVMLYGIGQVLIQQVNGTVDLPPAATVPVFLPGIMNGNQEVVGAFLTIVPSSIRWFSLPSDPRIIPVVSNTTVSGTDAAPRIDAVLTNPTTSLLSDVPVVVLVHSVQGEVIAASRTIVPSIPAQGQATATFTWNGPFSSVPAAIEVIPVIPLP